MNIYFSFIVQFFYNSCLSIIGRYMSNLIILPCSDLDINMFVRYRNKKDWGLVLHPNKTSFPSWHIILSCPLILWTFSTLAVFCRRLVLSCLTWCHAWLSDNTINKLSLRTDRTSSSATIVPSSARTTLQSSSFSNFCLAAT